MSCCDLNCEAVVDLYIIASSTVLHLEQKLIGKLFIGRHRSLAAFTFSNVSLMCFVI